MAGAAAKLKQEKQDEMRDILKTIEEEIDIANEMLDLSRPSSIKKGNRCRKKIEKKINSIVDPFFFIQN